MSVSQSALRHVGYDLVLALSQVGANLKLKTILAKANAPDRYVCAFKGGPPFVVCTYDEMLSKTNGIDPFPPSNGTIPPDAQQQLLEIGLQFAIHFRIGSYTMARFEKDIVTFAGPDSSAAYRLFFRAFEIGQMVTSADGNGPSCWQSLTQTKTKPWIYKVAANVSIDPVANRNGWPPAVLAECSKHPASAVSRIAFDLAGATLISLPTIAGLETDERLLDALRMAVLPQAVQDMTTAGVTTIGYWVKPSPPSLSVVTAMNSVLSPYRQPWNGQWAGPPPPPVPNPGTDESNASSLDLVCAVDDHALPGVTAFRWNWMTAQPLQDFHGVIAVNAGVIVESLRAQLDQHVFLSCWQPVVNVRNAQLTINEGGTPVVQTFPGQATALTYRFSAQAADEAYGVRVTFATSYAMEVSFQNFYIYPTPTEATTIAIHQHALMTVTVIKGSETIQANIVDYSLWQNIPLAIDANGRLVVQTPLPLSQIQNNSQAVALAQTDLSLQWLQNAVNNITNAAQTYAPPGSITPNFVTAFFFPFGEAFSFADIGFSENLDLYGHLTIAAD